VILSIATFLRFYKLDQQSLWVDELFSANLSSPDLSFSEVLSNFKKTAHPPFYFILLYFFAKIFGGTSLALKTLSAIIGVLGIFSIYKLGKELLNKNIGLMAAALLSFNYFHIYYSQEARMYGLLLLLATASFYFLVKLIKEPSFKRAIYYGICTALLVNTHYFGLLTLGAQIVILAYFTCNPFSVSRGQFIKYCSISGAITFFSYLPVFKSLEGHSKTTSLWIPKTHYNSLNDVFISFFGKSEVIVILVIILVLLFIVKISSLKDKKSFKIDPIKDKWVFSTILILTWLIVGILVPVYRSNAKVPIIIDRYFIHLLTPILLMCSIGLFSIKNQILRSGFLLVVILFSLVNMFYERWHYKGVYKSQFRETCDYVEHHKKEDTKLISALGRHLIYYLPNEDIKELNLSKYIKEMGKDSSLIQDFWYIDGHNNKYSISKAEEDFLNNKFTLTNSVTLFDAWAKFYVKKGD
jgi:uncharacterized membrane protein